MADHQARNEDERQDQGGHEDGEGLWAACAAALACRRREQPRPHLLLRNSSEGLSTSLLMQPLAQLKSLMKTFNSARIAKHLSKPKR